MERLFKPMALIVLLHCICAAYADAQVTPERIREDHGRAGGLFHSYEFDKIEDVRPPKGYRPFFMNHYGRHGSRRHTSYSYFETAREALHRADSTGNLTQDGMILLSQIDSLYRLHDGMWGELAAKGEKEHKILAERMCRRFPEIFSDRKRNVIEAFSSTMRRCIVSMAASTSTLMSMNQHLQVRYHTGDRYDVYLKDGMRNVEGKAWYEPLMHEKIESSCDWSAVMRRVFIEPDAAGVAAYDFSSSLWAAWAICQCVEDVHIEPLRFFDEEHLLHILKLRSQFMYLIHVRSDVFGTRALDGMKTLLNDFIVCADRAVEGNDVAAVMRYGHDSTLMPLAGMIGIEMFDEMHSISAPAMDWDLSEKTCMGANLQVVYYRKRDADPVLVKFMYNEKEVAIPALQPVHADCYYDWSNVKAYLSQILTK